ncbi:MULTISPECIES: hypothetical protein [unclassified Agrobacterium]
MNYLLDAGSLCSKWGFSDGDMFDEDPFDTLLFQGDGIWISGHLPLIASVRKFLVPKLDNRVVIEEIDTNHNPIRATEETMQFVDQGIEVEVTFDQVWSAFEEAYPDEAARAGKSGKPTDEDFC